MKRVIVATRNDGKIKEFMEFFAPLGIEVFSLKDLNDNTNIVESGRTFEENALIKAREIAKRYQMDCIADDSGLEVDALGGAPGIHSARYAGDHDHEANNARLLKELEGLPFEKRTARFVCALAYVTRDFKEYVVRGTVEGYIWFECRGTNGFGYDPLFYFPSLNKTFAELSMHEKQAISHRGHALEKIKNILMGESDESNNRRE